MSKAACNNHGECVDGLFTYTCNCDKDYSGLYCDSKSSKSLYCFGINLIYNLYVQLYNIHVFLSKFNL